MSTNKNNIKFSPDYNPDNIQQSIQDTIQDTRSEEQEAKKMQKSLNKGYNPIDYNDFKPDGTHPTLKDNYKATKEDINRLKPIVNKYRGPKPITPNNNYKQKLTNKVRYLHELSTYPSQTKKAIKLTEKLPVHKAEIKKIKQFFNERHSFKPANLHKKGFASNAQVDESSMLQNIIKKHKLEIPNLHENTLKPNLKVAQSIMKHPQNEKMHLSNTFKAIKFGLKQPTNTLSKESTFIRKYDYSSTKQELQFHKINKPSFDDKIAEQYQARMSSYLMQQDRQGIAYDTARRMTTPYRMQRINHQIMHPHKRANIKDVLKSIHTRGKSNHFSGKEHKKLPIKPRHKETKQRTQTKALSMKRTKGYER